MLGLRHLQFGTLAALACRLDITTVGVEGEAYAYEEAVDALATLGVATIAEGYVGQPLILLHLQIKVGCTERCLRHCHVGIRRKCQGAVGLEVGYGLIMGQHGVGNVNGLASVELL